MLQTCYRIFSGSKIKYLTLKLFSLYSLSNGSSLPNCHVLSSIQPALNYYRTENTRLGKTAYTKMG